MTQKDKEQENVMHENFDFDGIEEQDNPPPLWIMYIFYLTIIFSFTYVGYYVAKERAINEVTNSDLGTAWSKFNYDAEVKRAQNSEPKEVEIKENSLAQLTDPQMISEGEAIYTSNCVACHGAKAVGLVGPTLVDVYTLNEESVDELYTAIAVGTPAAGMPGWKPILGDKKIVKVQAYILSLNTQKPAEATEASPAPAEQKSVVAKTGDATKGKKFYATSCVTCHGVAGVGGIGPALTTYSESDAASLVQSIEVGVPAKGMPGWKPILGSEKIVDIAAYLISLKK